MHRSCHLAVTAVSFGLALLEASEAIAANVPNGFTVVPVVLGPFDANPTDFAFLPDGRILIIEKNTGNVRLATAGATTSSTILTVPLVVPTYEQGLVGIAVDPEWPARPYVYFHASVAGLGIQVLRYTGQGDLTDPQSSNLTFSNPYLILHDLPDQQGIHQGGTLRFGPDGYLYVSLGEDGSPCAAQDLSRLQGKILRIDVSAQPDSGTGPPPKSELAPSTNPYFNVGGNAALVYAYGFRNPFRFSIDPLTNALYVGDVGELKYEEVDEIPYDAPGANYGWPAWEGPLPGTTPGADSCSTEPFEFPIYQYLHEPVSSASVVCGPVVMPAPIGAFNYPSEYYGDLLVAEFFEGWIKRLERGPSGWQVAPPVPGQPDSENWATNFFYICEMRMGPDGALYALKLVNDGSLERGLYRVEPPGPTDVEGERQSLVARGAPNPARVGSGFTVRYALAVPIPAVLRVYDPAGRLVRTLQARAGASSVRWDGRTEAGRAAPAGVYGYRLETSSGVRTSGKFALVP